MKGIFCFWMMFLLGSMGFAQNTSVTVSGQVKDASEVLPFVNVVLNSASDTAFVTGTVTDMEGRFTMADVRPGNYLLQVSYIGYTTKWQSVFVGNLSPFLDLNVISLDAGTEQLDEVVIEAKQDAVAGKLDKKTFTVDENVSQTGGSVLQAMQNLPGVTIQDGKVQLRGNDKVAVLIDGKQTALTGFGSQSGLDNIPASAIEKIEVINNPSAKYDANGNAGIVNIIFKKEDKSGFNGKVGLTGGVGSLWLRKQNLPTIRPQYQATPKVNPSVSLNYRKGKVNLFLQADYLFTQTLNKNEFVTRTYDDGTVIQQQTKRNRDTHFATAKAGFDWYINDANSLTVSGLFGSEKILDNGDEPFFNADLTNRLRLWQFLEDELKTTVLASAQFEHKFKQPGHLLKAGANYTFHRENEQYFFDNIYPTYTGHDRFKLLSDEQVMDLTTDYVKPLKYGRLEAGIKFRYRNIPTNMQFFPGLNSPLDTNAGGWATYNEIIPAAYGTYVFENKHFEAEVGMRVEYVKVDYKVNPDHSTYKSDGYDYVQPFPNVRLAYKINDRNKLTLFYNRRVDRPNEVDIRIFPKYDDAEIIKVGNPALRPQFTNLFELGYKTSWKSGYFYAAAYHRLADATITRISSSVDSTKLIYAIFQNAGHSYNTGLEVVLSQKVAKWYTFDLNMTGYYNIIESYSVVNKYPTENIFTAPRQTVFSGNVKLNNNFNLPKNFSAQLTFIYLAPDIIPQGTIGHRFSINLGVKKTIQKGKGELFLNATDLANTLVLRQTIQGDDFHYTSTNYNETQVFRLGYSYKF